MPIIESAKTLIGSDGCTYSSYLSQDQGATETRNPFQAGTYHFHKMYMAFMFRDFDSIRKFADIFVSSNKTIWTCMISGSSRLFYGGLVSFWIARATKNSEFWATMGEEAIAQMEVWSKASPWNFQNKLHLLSAEAHFFYGNHESAAALYEASISSAKKHRFVHEEALAMELAGCFSLKINRTELALGYLKQSHKRYEQWGAFAKANSLAKFIQSCFGEFIP